MVAADAASFKRVLGAGPANIFENLRRRTLYCRRTRPSCCMSVGRVPFISVKLSRTSERIAALLIEEHRHTGESVRPAYFETSRKTNPPSLLYDWDPGDSCQRDRWPQLVSRGIFTKTRKQPKPLRRLMKYRITTRPNRRCPASYLKCIALLRMLIVLWHRTYNN